MDRRIGVVRKWTDRGFGFIKVLEKRDDGLPARVDDSFPDVFLHWYACKEAGFNKIAVGDVLEFDVVQNAKGLNAANVAFVQ
jgi:cold shock CspA family protein